MRPARLLLCWPYERPALLLPFLRLSGTGRFELTHLYHPQVSDEQAPPLTPYPIRYWTEFDNAQHILESVRPDAIVFQGIASPRTVALNVIAKAARIPTYVLQHGTYYTIEDSLREARAMGQVLARTPRLAGQFQMTAKESTSHAVEFLHRSLKGARALDIPLVLAFSAFIRAARVHALPLRAFRFPGRLPTATICHSPHNEVVARQIDGDGPPRIIIGNPEYDDYFRQAATLDLTGDYYLFIDSIVAAPELNVSTMSVASATSIYRRLSAFAAARGKRLVVKLHPLFATTAWLPRDLPNVDWVSHAELPELLRCAIGCFGYFSTLLLHAAWLKPVCLIEHIPLDIGREFAACAGAPVVSAEYFDPASFEFRSRSPHAATELERRFFWKADGRATERLGAVLASGAMS